MNKPPLPISLRRCAPGDLDDIIALNDAALPHVSEKPRSQWERFCAGADYFRVVTLADGTLAGFLIAMSPEADYDSPNFLWFCDRFDDGFLYIDRIVIGAQMRGRGLGRRLYEDLFAFAEGRVPRVSAEVNSQPPNPESMAFHKVMGFESVGEQQVGEKAVVYLSRTVG